MNQLLACNGIMCWQGHKTKMQMAHRVRKRNWPLRSENMLSARGKLIMYNIHFKKFSFLILQPTSFLNMLIEGRTNSSCFRSCGAMYCHCITLKSCNYLFPMQYSRKVSQTRWIIDDERMGEASVEVKKFLRVQFLFSGWKHMILLTVYRAKHFQEIVGGTILPICQGDSYKFHAAGREDIDV